MPTLKIEFTFKGVIPLFQGLFLLPLKLEVLKEMNLSNALQIFTANLQSLAVLHIPL